MSMSADSSPKFGGLNEKNAKLNEDVEGAGGLHERTLSVATLNKGEVLTLQDVDPALNAKMHLVNDVRDYREAQSNSVS